MDDDDFFADDATFDTLGEDELRALEDSAVKNSQLPSNFVQPPRQNPHHDPTRHHQSRRQPVSWRSSATAQPLSGVPDAQQHRQFHAYQKPAGYVAYSQKQQQRRAIPQLGQDAPPSQTMTAHTGKIESQNYDAPTYQSPGAIPPQPQSHYPQRFEEPTLPIIVQNTTLPNFSYSVSNNNALPEKPSSDYGDFDGFEETAELWDMEGPTVIHSQKEAQQYPVFNGGADMYQQPAEVENWVDRQEASGDGAEDVVMGNSQYEQHNAPEVAHPERQDYVNPEELGQLRVQIDNLQTEKALLVQELERIRKMELAKSGEVAIVRNNLEKNNREHERIVASLQNFQAEERQKYDSEIDAMKKEMERIKTDHAFLTKEVEDIAKQNRVLRSDLKSQKQQHEVSVGMAGPYDVIGGLTGTSQRPPTPKRMGKSYAHRDGFDDDEVMLISPSRRGKSRTPTKAGTKRKRSMNGSPSMQLPLSHSGNIPVTAERVPIVDDRILEKLFQQDDRLEFFEALMTHRHLLAQERAVNLLSKFTFPSAPQVNLSAWFVDKITSLRAIAPHNGFPAGISRLLLDLWFRCLKEEFYDPLSVIVELFRFSLLWNQAAQCYEIMDDTLEILQRTVDLNTIPLATRKGGPVGDEVPTIACLQVMEDMAMASLKEEMHIIRFWRQVRADFPIICLYPAQPIEVMRRIASILCTSAVGDTFGPITTTNVDVQREHENYLLEAATKPLEVVPRGPMRDSKYSAMEILELRRELVQFLGCVCSIEPGLLALAKHERAAFRLAIRIAEEVDQCYDWRLGEEARMDFINSAVRILHGIIISHPDEVAAELTTNHKHLVSMTRLAFSEGIAQETGLEIDVTDSAFQLLENMVTPEEATALEAMFNFS